MMLLAAVLLMIAVVILILEKCGKNKKKETSTDPEELNRAYYRFLPSEIINRLGKESVLTVNRGDCVLINTHILHISLVNFNVITKDMESGEIFNCYNEICKDIMLIVMAWGGLVESYDQDEFICLFEDSNDVFQASVALNKQFNSFNSDKEKPLKTVISLTAGKALVGISGYEERLGTLTLSEEMALAEILANIGALYGANIIYSENTVDPNFKRYLGSINHNGDILRVYDCFESDETETFQSKNSLLTLFENAVELFEENKWEESKLLFIKYMRESVPDPAAKEYLFLCEFNLTQSEKPLSFGKEPK